MTRFCFFKIFFLFLLYIYIYTFVAEKYDQPVPVVILNVLSELCARFAATIPDAYKALYLIGLNKNVISSAYAILYKYKIIFYIYFIGEIIFL